MVPEMQTEATEVMLAHTTISNLLDTPKHWFLYIEQLASLNDGFSSKRPEQKNKVGS